MLFRSWNAIVSFVVGGTAGLLFQYVWPLPNDFSSSLAALAIAFVVHIVLHLLFGNRVTEKIELLADTKEA